VTEHSDQSENAGGESPLPSLWRPTVHYGCKVDEKGFHRVVRLRDYGRAPEIVGPPYRTPREAIRAAERMEEG
jgi:hypothetical protein